jgi:acetoacetyl-CoA synthetase
MTSTIEPSAAQEHEIIWRPSPEVAGASEMERFRSFSEARAGHALPDFAALYAWSIAAPEAFWDAVWDFAEIRGDKGARIIEPAAHIKDWRFFPDASLNFAENLLWKRGEGDAIVFECEDKMRRRRSWDELAALVSRIQQGLAAEGVKPGDRVAGLLPNIPEAIAFMLAAVGLGATWSCASPDFGPSGVVDRFGQIEPVVLVTCDGYVYAGKTHVILDKVGEIVERLPSLRRVVVVPYLGEALPAHDKIVGLEAFLNPHPAGEPTFVRLPADHPLYILFSSGTTGVPKCIVHRAGLIVQHAKEHRLHCDIKEGDRVYWFTTLSWMMWNWLASALSAGATVMLYDGSPFHPTPDVILDYAERERFTLLGTSARWIDALRKAGIDARDRDLSAARVLASTGSPLAPANYAYVYDKLAPHVHLVSTSGGTDLCASFVGGNPLGAVRVGEIEAPTLGMAVEIWGDDGKPVPSGVKGELVCTQAFPSMPLGFWNDPDRSRYFDAYYARFDNVWHHGDFAEVTAHGGYVIHGRSDATLNPGGVRIGTAELYAQIEGIAEILEALAIGQTFEHDTRIVLFVRLQPGATLDDALVDRIKTAIRTGATPRHVPAKVIAVPDIPRTKSGKVVEIAVRDLVNGREVKNADALANPEALTHFRDIAALRS